MDGMDMLPQVKEAAGLEEAYHVTTFRGYRTTARGRHQQVTVEVLDGGPEMGLSRFTVKAYGDDDTTATGNAGDTLHAALRHVHWFRLDGRHTP